MIRTINKHTTTLLKSPIHVELDDATCTFCVDKMDAINMYIIDAIQIFTNKTSKKQAIRVK
jgi:hypothetical protein